MRTCQLHVFVAAAAVLALAIPAVAQGPIDLTITEIGVSLQGDQLAVSAEVSLLVGGDYPPIATAVDFYLDSQYVGSVEYLATPTLPSTCPYDTPPDCSGTCTETEINGQPVVASGCMSFVWSGIPEQCICLYAVFTTQTLAPYGDQLFCTATIDAQDSVGEADETNNTMMIALGPVLDDGRTWSEIKDLYQ